MWIEQRVYDLARSRSLPESIKTPYFNDNIKSVMILWENNTNSQMWKDWSPSRFYDFVNVYRNLNRKAEIEPRQISPAVFPFLKRWGGNTTFPSLFIHLGPVWYLQEQIDRCFSLLKRRIKCSFMDRSNRLWISLSVKSQHG